MLLRCDRLATAGAKERPTPLTYRNCFKRLPYLRARAKQRENYMRMRTTALASMLTVAAATGLVAAPAAAAERRAPAAGTLGWVTAESRYGGQAVSGPVRRGPQGRLEVRLPGGTWMECGQSCADTLRRETVDFWRANRDRANSGDGPGYLKFRF
jgi:hypothetical protein